MVLLRRLHTQDKEEARREVLQMAVDGKRNRGRQNRTWRDVLKENMARYNMTADMAEESRFWDVIIRAVTLLSLEANIHVTR